MEKGACDSCALSWIFHLKELGRDDKEGESKRQWPIADPKYWFLLQQTLASSVSSARPLKVWLLPLLFRINLAGIATELLTLSHNQASCNDLAIIYAPARAALAILWPLAEKRVGMDALLESLSTVLGACATWTTQAENANDVTMQTYREDLAWICNTIISSYRNALGNFGNKKKVGVCRFCINLRSSTITYIPIAIYNLLVYTPATLDSHSLTSLLTINPGEQYSVASLRRALRSRY